MAPRDPSRVQLDFPQLTADIIAALRLTGTLGLFNMSDVVVPTISVGNIRPQTVEVNPVQFDSSEVFSVFVVNPAINTVILDTGALPAGVYDCLFGIASHNTDTQVNVEIQWRNALNDTTLASWPSAVGITGAAVSTLPLGPFSVNMGLNERLRIQVLLATLAGRIGAYMMVALRPTP